MYLILTPVQYNYNFHMDYNSDTGTNIISFIFNSDRDGFRWQEIEMEYILNSD